MDLHCSSHHTLSKAGVAAPKSHDDISSTPLEIYPLTSTNSTAEIAQNIISQLLAKIVEDMINKDLKTCNAKEKVNI